MVEWMVSAPASGGGKTMVTTALLAALRRRGLRLAAFKTGPDYIDPSFHRAVQGTRGCNLDLFLAGEERVRQLYRRYAAGCDAAVVEGAMGFYDGLGGNTVEASSWDVRRVLGIPVLLVVEPKGQSVTLAAVVRGLQSFRPESGIRAVLLNNTTERMAQLLAPLIEAETGLPVVGRLPRLAEAAVESRHLGLFRAEELPDWERRLEALGSAFEAHVDVDELLLLGEGRSLSPLPEPPQPGADAPCLAVARDEAFRFCYEETLDALRGAGLRLAFFSPLRDERLPEGCGGIYLPGGYPENYAAALAANRPMREAIREAVGAGMPAVAECGGFLYLSSALADREGQLHPMAGVFPGEGCRKKGLVRFGYGRLCAEADGLLLRAGESTPMHEFHHYDTDANGEDFLARKPDGRQWKCGYGGERLYAGFPHLYFAGDDRLPARFAAAVREYQKGK